MTSISLCTFVFGFKQNFTKQTTGKTNSSYRTKNKIKLISNTL